MRFAVNPSPADLSQTQPSMIQDSNIVGQIKRDHLFKVMIVGDETCQ